METLTTEQIERLEECSEALGMLQAELENAESPEEIGYVRSKVHRVIIEILELIG